MSSVAVDYVRQVFDRFDDKTVLVIGAGKMGELTLRLPRNVGVRLTLDRFLVSFDPAGLVRTGDAFQSPGYERAERTLDIDVTTAVGGVKVEWLGRES